MDLFDRLGTLHGEPHLYSSRRAYGRVDLSLPGKRHFFLLVITLVFAGSSAIAQTARYRWQDELCTYEGTYNPRKVTLAQLKNTRKLVQSGSYSSFDTNTTVWQYSDIVKLDVGALDREFKRKSNELRTLDIVDTIYFQDLRRSLLHELEQSYRLNRATMLAYKERSALLQYQEGGECTTKFAKPLMAGGDALLSVWKAVNLEARKNNSDPARLERIFDQQMRSGDRLKYALLEVMSFGWFNCANALIPYVEYDGTQETEYKKLFGSVRTIHCDEP